MPRVNKWSRLNRPANKGDRRFWVDPGLDWVAGDKLGVMATSFEPSAGDSVTIASYNNATGEVRITRPLDYYHFGRAQSTGDLYSGVDIRGEVMLLTRNVKIIG